MSEKVNVFFEIETINRELDFRLFLASLAATSKTRFYIGQTDAIFNLVSESHNGLYLGKNLRPTNEDWSDKRHGRYKLLKQRGHKLIWLDEEGGVFWGERPEWEQMLLRSLDPAQLDADDQVCAWGDLQRDFYLSLNPACGANLTTTGHPRFDLYKPKYREYFAADVARLREQYGDFLLVNTNFHRANTVEGLKKIFSNRVKSFTSSDRYYLLERWLHINHVLTDFARAITALCVELPQLNIVIRPHPSENVDFYRLMFDGAKNVHVTQEGSVGPWLFASRAMMHDGCTTAIEGHMCDTQVINYKPVIDERFDIPLPNSFGVRCQSPEQAVDMMTRVLRGEKLSEEDESERERKDTLRASTPDLIANFPVEREAFGVLVQQLQETAATLPLQSEIAASQSSGFHKKEEPRRAFGFLSGARGGKKKSKNKKGLETGMQPKFYGLQEADVPARMKAIQKMLDKNIRYTMHSNELMCIESD